MNEPSQRRYKATEAKYKGRAEEMYVTYDIEQKTRGGNEALYPKVQRVYIAGQVKEWHVGEFEKRTGKHVHGVKIEYEQSRQGYQRKGYTATRGGKEYQVKPSHITGGKSSFAKIVEVPEGARNVTFHEKLPAIYEETLQNIR